jgi:hypothetical protein
MHNLHGRCPTDNANSLDRCELAWAGRRSTAGVGATCASGRCETLSEGTERGLWMRFRSGGGGLGRRGMGSVESSGQLRMKQIHTSPDPSLTFDIHIYRPSVNQVLSRPYLYRDPCPPRSQPFKATSHLSTRRVTIHLGHANSSAEGAGLRSVVSLKGPQRHSFPPEDC